MNCHEFRGRLEAERDARAVGLGVGAPPPASRLGLLEHASGCGSCADVLAAEDRLRAALASLREAGRAPSDLHGFAARVRRAVRETQAAPAPRNLAWPALASAAASVLGLAVIVGVSLRGGPEPAAESLALLVTEARPQASEPRADARGVASSVLLSNGIVEVVSHQRGNVPGTVFDPSSPLDDEAVLPAPASGPRPASADGLIPASADGLIPASADGLILVEWDL